MTLFSLISEEVGDKQLRLVASAALAGVCSIVALILISSVARDPQAASVANFVAFAVAASASVLAGRLSSRAMVATIETALQRIVARIVHKIEHAEFRYLERLGSAEILNRVTENVTVVSISSSAMGAILPAVCIFFCGCLYLFALSPLAFALLCLLQFMSIYLYWRRNAASNRLIKEEGTARVRVLAMLMELLGGAKEIRFGRARTRDVLIDFKENSQTVSRINARTNQLFDDNALFVTVNLYVLLGAMAFVLPEHADIKRSLLSKLIAAILFLWGSVRTVLSVYLSYVQANDALANIDAFEKRIENYHSGSESSSVDPWRGELGPIRFADVEYRYPAENGDTPFHIGPLSFTISPGEVLFVVGGNGSGKSTLLKVLTGLYLPTAGTLQVGNAAVEPNNAEFYREMISVIFADFHLFSRVYGLPAIKPEQVYRFLQDMQIETKTSFQNGEFTQQKLSTGQKKRLAMVLALLEDRPLVVLDEWAADQDPEFRKHFYEHIIPSLKAAGKTVIAVSHDDRYFHCADRILTMQYGQVLSIEAPRLREGLITETGKDPSAAKTRRPMDN